MSNINAYPLTWPIARQRLPASARARARFDLSMARARDAIYYELERLGAKSCIISTNIKLRLDGAPKAGEPEPHDPAVAVYFTYKQQEHCFACDRWDRVQDNMQAVAKTIEALRGISRWGTGDMMEAAFTGFAALPPPIVPARLWWVVLGFESQPATLAQARSGWVRMADEHHSDKGGSHERMTEINAAWATAQKVLAS